MKNDNFYFPHDYHSRNDPKCMTLITQYGLAAYGVYWSLIEIMHEEGGKIRKFPALYDGLANSFHMPKDELLKHIEAMLHDCELLLEDENYIWSERVIRNIEERAAKKVLRSQAGQLGGIKSGISRKQRSIASSKRTK